MSASPVSASPVLLELCCGGIDDVLLAARCGVERIELNSAMPLGGLTPSAALMSQARAAFKGRVIAMLRPREGGFCYSSAEYELMLDEARRLVDLGVDGIAVGLLGDDATLDAGRCTQLRRVLPNTQLVCHRAFDVVADRDVALRQLIDFGFNRVLTSGGAQTALLGANELQQLNVRFGDQIEILAGGGIRANNVADIVRISGCRQVHSSVQTVTEDRSASQTFRDPTGQLHFGVPGQSVGSYLRCDEQQLRELQHAIQCKGPCS